MGIQLKLILIAYIVHFGLTFARRYSQSEDQAVIKKANDESEIRENFQNLYNSITKNDPKKSDIYHDLLKEEVVREQQSFDAMKDQFRIAQIRNNYRRRNFYIPNNINKNFVATKRETNESNPNPIDKSENLEQPLSTSESPYARRKLSLGVADIREILEQNYAYVDKTGSALHLIRQGRSCHISRPKGFGKTLFLSTLEEILKGNKELFRGTEIYNSDYNWTKHAVYRVDFSEIDRSTTKAFETGLKEHLVKFIESNGVAANKSENLITILSLLQNVTLVAGVDIVVLVDEYDAPITDNVQHPRKSFALKTADENREVIAFFLKFVTRSLYNPNIKFAFVVGFNKFEWVKDAPLHLLNIDLESEYATMMGFTEEEVRSTFRNHIRDISRRRSRRNNVTEEEILEEIRLWYGGYRFSDKEIRVFNPASTLRYLSARKADNYWYASRNRSFLIDEAARDNMPLGLRETTVGLRLKPQDFNISSLSYIDVRALMYHAGYVTIRKCHPEKRWFDLDFPNKEARDAYNNTYLRRDRRKEHHRVLKD